MSPDELALWNAVLDRPADDLPRLVYADWLEEGGRGALAAFIRAQCDLAHATPARPDHPDLVERQAEAVAAVRAGRGLPAPDLPEGAHFSGSIHGFDGFGAYRRGFPDAVELGPRGRYSNLFTAGTLARAVDRVVRETTARRLILDTNNGEAGVTAVLQAKGFGRVTGLEVRGFRAGDADVLSAVAGSHFAANWARLAFTGDAAGGGLRDLAEARLEALADFEAPNWTHLPAEAVEPVYQAPWFTRLKSLSVAARGPGTAAALAEGLGGAHDLAALGLYDLRNFVGESAEPLARAHLPKLAELKFFGLYLTGSVARQLARAPWPPVRSLAFTGGMANLDDLRRLGDAPWLAGVRELSFHSLRDSAGLVAVLAEMPLAKTLRHLTITHSGLAPADLHAAGSGAFPVLTTLDAPGSAVAAADDLQRLGERWAAPTIRSLTLDGWPLGNPGARRLAANPAFAGLRRLKLRKCQLTDAGAQALMLSPYLRELRELDLANNNLRGQACLTLRDPDCLPHLTLGDLTGSKLKPDERGQLRFARPAVWV